MAALVLVLGAAAWSSAGDTTDPPPGALITLSARPAASPAIPAGFLGVSLEFPAVRAYTGADPTAVNPVLVQLIRNLAPGQSPSLRIGGDSADRTWWPVPGVTRPHGITYQLTPGWLSTTRALARELGARLIVGVDLAMNNAGLAAAEARALLAGIGRSSVSALEIGNEPDVYNAFPRYRTASGRRVRTRPRTYNIPAFIRDFSRIRQALPPAPIAGPAFGSVGWMSKLPRFLAAEPGLGLVTFHRYPLSCYAPPGSPKYPTIADLLSDTASHGLAATVAPFVTIAHTRGLRLRVDEMNSVACAGRRGVSDTFASALWILDTLFEMARVGVDGVNIHTLPGARYQLFSFIHRGNSWQGSVYPEYYGLLMFARAAPPGSRLIPVTGSAGPSVKLWATRAPNRTIRVVLINQGTSAVHVAVAPPAGMTASARLERLLAAGAAATSGVTLGGQTFGADTETGLLSGEARATIIQPSSGRYETTLPPASASLLTF